MHGTEGHVSSSSFIYKTDKTFKDIRRKQKLTVKRFPLSIPHVILLWNSLPQEIITPRNFTMDISVHIRNRAFMSDNNILLEGMLNFVLQGSHQVLTFRHL